MFFSQYIGFHDLILRLVSGRFSAKGNMDGIIVEANDIVVDVSVDQFSVRGKSATAKMLSAFLSPYVSRLYQFISLL